MTHGTRIPPGGSIRIPPGGHVTLEISQGGVYQDRAGGPALEVSSQVLPDAMAVYLLATTIIECTRGMERHTQALERYEVVTKRHARWHKILGIATASLLAVSLGNLAFYLWGVWHFHG
jgi:hypothetical protein